MANLARGEMIESEIERNSSGEYNTVVYWHKDCFTDSPPYRKIVKWILEKLRTKYKVEIIDEPEEMEGEDFVYHELQVDGRKMQIYWENSLGYMSFISSDCDLIQELSRYLCRRKPKI